MDISWMIVTALCVVPFLAVVTYVLWREECESVSGDDAIADWSRYEQAKAKPRATARTMSSARTLEARKLEYA